MRAEQLYFCYSSIYLNYNAALIMEDCWIEDHLAMAMAEAATTQPQRTDYKVFFSSSQQQMPAVVSPKRAQPKIFPERDLGSQGGSY